MDIQQKDDFSHNSEETELLSSFKHLKKYPEEPIQIYFPSQKDFQSIIDFVNQGKKSSAIIADSSWSDGRGKSLFAESVKLTVTEGSYDAVFPGSLIRGESISPQEYTPFIQDYDYTPLPIVVSVPFPTKHVSDTLTYPSRSTTDQFILNALKQSDLLGKQVKSFSYEMNQITNYSQLKLSFGVNFNLGSFLTVGASFDKEKVKKNTALTAKFLQENFTLTMNLPRKGQLIDRVSDKSILQYSPVYVNSVTYGRLGILLAESRYSYDSLSIAFKAAIKFGKDKSSGLSANIDTESVKMLDEAEIKIFIAGGDGKYAVKTVNGFQGFIDYIKEGGVFSADNYGVPISFTARYLSDLSPYKSRFRIDMNDK